MNKTKDTFRIRGVSPVVEEEIRRQVVKRKLDGEKSFSLNKMLKELLELGLREYMAGKKFRKYEGRGRRIPEGVVDVNYQLMEEEYGIGS